MFSSPPKIIFQPTFARYSRLLIKEQFYKYYLNSIIVAVSGTALALLLGSLFAFAFEMFEFRLNKLLFSTVLITRAYMPFTTALPIIIAAHRLGLLDTRILLILFYSSWTIPLVMYIMRNFFHSIPREISESAQLDGCTMLGVFSRIIIPLSAPGLIAIAVLIFIYCWNEFLFALIATSFDARTAPVMLVAFKESELEVHWGELSTLGLLTIGPAFAFMLLLKKYLISGLTAGAVSD